MSPREAEEWLGVQPSHDGAALLRVALEAERRLGRRFLIRRGGQGRGVRYKLTRPMIQRYLPDLWQTRFDRISARVQRIMDDIRTHIDARIDERIESHPVVLTLQARSDNTIEQVSRLAEQVSRIAGVPKSPQESLRKKG